MDTKSKIILIYGPTASGKSSFAVRLAQNINGEIINADSMQMYKQLKILMSDKNISMVCSWVKLVDINNRQIGQIKLDNDTKKLKKI